MSPPRPGWGCHRWSLSSFWFCPPVQWHTDHWSRFYPWLADPEHTALGENRRGKKQNVKLPCMYVGECVSTHRWPQNHVSFCSTALQLPPVLGSFSCWTVSNMQSMTRAVSWLWWWWWRELGFCAVSDSARTCDADLGRPLRGTIEHALLDLLHVRDVRGLHDGEHLLNEFKDLGFVPLADLHAVLKDHDDVLGSVLCAVLGALLGSSWLGAKTQKWAVSITWEAKPLAWLRGKEIWKTDGRDEVAGETDRHNCFYNAVK